MKAQFLFFMGKGGVGKSTISSLCALNLNAHGFPVLLVSLDPAHNLSDILELKVQHNPKKIKTGLMAMQIDHSLWLKKYLGEVQNRIENSYRYLTALNMEKYFDVIQNSPGTEEFALLLAFENLQTKYVNKYRFIIVDMPPTALALRFFQLPGLTLRWINHLRELRQEIITKRNIITRIKLGKTETETDAITGNLERQLNRYKELNRIFSSDTEASIHIVLNPETLSINESKMIVKELNHWDMPIADIIINKYQNQEQLDQVAGFFPDYSLNTFPLVMEKVTGIDQLSSMCSKLACPYIDESN